MYTYILLCTVRGLFWSNGVLYPRICYHIPRSCSCKWYAVSRFEEFNSLANCVLPSCVQGRYNSLLFLHFWFTSIYHPYFRFLIHLNLCITPWPLQKIRQFSDRYFPSFGDLKDFADLRYSKMAPILAEVRDAYPFSTKSLKDAEMEVLNCLNLNLNAVTTNHYTTILLEAAPPSWSRFCSNYIQFYTGPWQRIRNFPAEIRFLLIYGIVIFKQPYPTNVSKRARFHHQLSLPQYSTLRPPCMRASRKACSIWTFCRLRFAIVHCVNGIKCAAAGY